jgi:hypothetical protein
MFGQTKIEVYHSLPSCRESCPSGTFCCVPWRPAKRRLTIPPPDAVLIFQGLDDQRHAVLSRIWAELMQEEGAVVLQGSETARRFQILKGIARQGLVSGPSHLQDRC